MDFIRLSKVSQGGIKILPPEMPLAGHQLSWDLVPDLVESPNMALL